MPSSHLINYDFPQMLPAAKAEKREPLRCFEGSAQPYAPFWRMVDAANSESGEAEIELYGVISEYSWLEDDITPKKFKDDLYGTGKGGPVTLRIDSPGGDVIAASRLRTIIDDYPGHVTARIDGLAASAAVIVTMAADTRRIMDSAYMMIHDPAVVVFMAALDIETLGRLRDSLRAIKDGIVPVYQARTGLSEGQISRMMADETWMSARKAVELGFADEVIEGGPKKASALANAAYVNCLMNYANIPPALMQAAQPEEDETVDSQPGADSSETPEADEREREAQTLRDRVRQLLQKETEDA